MAAMFDAITPTYDLLNRVLSMGNDGRWRRRAVDALDPHDGERFADIGCGTAELLLEVHGRAPGAGLVGVDVSDRMLAAARAKARDTGVPMDLVHGDALRLPLPDASLDGIVTAFTLRNVPGVGRFFAECHRVLRPGGRVVSLEIHLPERGAFAAVYRPYFLHVLPAVGDLLSGRTGAYRYLAKSVADFHAPEEVGDLARKAGFEAVTVAELTFGTAAIVRGQKP